MCTLIGLVCVTYLMLAELYRRTACAIQEERYLDTLLQPSYEFVVLDM